MEANMQQANMLNPDDIVNNNLSAKIAMFDSKQRNEAALAAFAESNQQLVTTISIMKNRILELEAQLKEAKTEKKPK